MKKLHTTGPTNLQVIFCCIDSVFHQLSQTLTTYCPSIWYVQYMFCTSNCSGLQFSKFYFHFQMWTIFFRSKQFDLQHMYSTCKINRQYAFGPNWWKNDSISLRITCMSSLVTLPNIYFSFNLMSWKNFYAMFKVDFLFGDDQVESNSNANS